jgi:hypothetical protein
MCTLRAKQIKKTKTILRDYICGIDGVYRRLRHCKKNAGRRLSRKFFAALASTNAGEKNHKEKKKDDPFLAIGENYINKMFLFF